MTKNVLEALASGPKIVERMLRVFPTERLDERAAGDRFTARESVAHCAALEEIHLDRMRKAVDSPGYKIASVDPWEAAKTDKYSDKDPFHEAEVFASRREMTIAFLAGLTDAQLSSAMETPEGQTITVLIYALDAVSHDMAHVDLLTHHFANEAATLG